MKTSRKTSSRKARPLMFIASSVWVALILVILVFRGGGTAPVERSLKPSGLSPAQQAAALVDLGDYEGAWTLYYQALQAAPEDVSLWYGLGVTLSHLNQRKGTEKAFQYVVRYGNPDAEEVHQARRWLISAGVWAEPVRFPSAPAPQDVTSGTAVVQGKITWGEPEPGRRPLKVRIVLEGLSGAVEGKRFHTRVAQGEVYRLEGLPPGSYRLIGRAAGHRLWDLALAVEDGKPVTQDLSKGNSSNPAVALSR